MQKIGNGKENLNGLLANYRPIGPRHLLAAALMQQARKEAEHEAREPLSATESKIRVA
jgi:hypothetical protein